MTQSPTRVALVLLFIFIGCFGAAFAAAGMLTPLPAPAAGGTCGPSTGSEAAIEALAEPGSIGAGPQPSASNTTAHQQWQTFVDQCQSLADRRGLASLVILVGSLAVSVIGLVWVSRRSRADRDRDERVDGASDWPVGSGGGGELVGAGAMIAAPGVPVGGWAPPGVPPAPVAPYPYPYPTAPSAPAEPTSPYGAAPASPPYPPGTPYPAATPYPPPTPYPAVTPYPASPTVAPPDAAPAPPPQPPPAPADRPGDEGPVPPAPPA